MAANLPSHLTTLLAAPEGVARDTAWAAFLDQYSPLLLGTARSASPNHDGAMDHYAFILDRLQEDGFHRLGAFAGDGRGKFTTWLVVVARRLCVDNHRHTHGRTSGQESSVAQSVEVTARRGLVELLSSELNPELLEDERAQPPDTEVLETERHRAIHDAVGALDVDDQLLLTLRFEDSLPVTKIAPMMGWQSRFQVHRRLKSVLGQLREALRDRGITEP